MENTSYSGKSFLGNVISSDVRFGTTFLDADFVDKAAPGEVIKDNMTGELYLKRSIDGKVVSFSEKTVSVFEFLQEFNIVFQSSDRFRYPEHSGGYLMGVHFDVNKMITHKSGDRINIYENNLNFPVDITPDNNFIFNVSPETNGIYIKPTLRNGDRNSSGYMSGKFCEDEYVDFTSVGRTFKSWLTMNLNYADAHLYDIWKNMSGWMMSNALIDITLTIVGTNSVTGSVVTNVIDTTKPIRLNEQNYVQFPDDYSDNLEKIISIQVKVKKIYFPKLQYEFSLSKTTQSETGLTNPLARLIEADLQACVKNIEVYYFISNTQDLPFGENRVIHQCIDYEFLTDAIDKLLTASGTRSVQSTVTQPSGWGIDSMWLEEVRNIYPGGFSEPTESKNTLENVERMLYDPTSASPRYVSFTQSSIDGDNMYVENN